MFKPATKFIKNSPVVQFGHILSEVVEAYNELVKYEEKKTEQSKLILARELVDIQVSCETMLACLGYPEVKRELLRQYVYQKNEVRGYYAEKESIPGFVYVTTTHEG